MNIPKESSFTLQETIKDPTLDAIALVHATTIALDHLGNTTDSNELLGISSVAFSNYVYNPDYNQHEIERRDYSPYSELISNYGIFESMAHYTGFSISEVNGLSDDDIWKLIRFEILHERPFISMDTEFNIDVISGYAGIDDVPEERQIVANGKSTSMRIKLQGEDLVFINWGVLIRPGDPTKERTPKIRQQTNLLNWVVSHGFSKKEFFHETRENYACGVHGLEVMQTRVAAGLDPTGLESFTGFVSRLLIKRKAAAFCLKDWSQEIAQNTAPEVEGLLNAAAVEYEKLVDLFSDDQPFVASFLKTIEFERNALSFIREASVFFPSAFG